MSEPQKTAAISKKFILPLTIVSSTDINRVMRELEALGEFLAQSSARNPSQDQRLPALSRNLERVAKGNDVDLLNSAARAELNKLLVTVKESSPRLHISLAADPSAAFLEKIVGWLRNEINTTLLVQVGLQPSIAAGCIIRTPNRSFDFSLRSNFSASRAILIDKIRNQL